jgi:gamma-butyrobetaine dioxygenase/trimethyllysine dioxygenase
MADNLSRAARHDAPRVETFDQHLRVHFGEGPPRWADFHYRWLRHQCDRDLHPTTRERTVDASEIPDTVRPERAYVDDAGRTLIVRWARPSGPDPDEDRTSTYALDWLRAHAYAPERAAAPPPPSDVGAITIDAGELPPREVARALLERVEHDGVVLVRRFDGARDPEAATALLIEVLAERGLRGRGTHFGAIEDLRTDNTTNANTDQLGYTDAPIELHTDQPFLEHPPRYQLLQCIRPAHAGGESHLVDARAAAAHLADHDAEADALRRGHPVRFHRRQRAFEAVFEGPILAGYGDDFRIRHSYFTFAPHRLPFAHVEAWYAAYARFTRLVRDPRHQFRFLLSAGDFVFYDNARMLHGRSGFHGARWLRGIYFDRTGST